MNTQSLVSINGKMTNGNDASISIFDRGFLYGDSIYEVTHTYQFHPIKFDEHLDRLWKSAAGLDIKITSSKCEIKELCFDLIKKFNNPSSYLRIIITRGEGPIGLDPSFSEKNNLIIIIQALPENPVWWYSKGVHMIIADTRRNPVDSINPNIKSGNYLNNVLAYSEAKRLGAFDAIMLNHKGEVTEGTTNNVWLVKNGVLKTPPVKAGILSGITRQAILEICQKQSFPYEICNLTPEDFKSADEAFLTSSTKFLVPIVKIDEQVIGKGIPGECAIKLLDLYKASIIENN